MIELDIIDKILTISEPVIISRFNSIERLSSRKEAIQLLKPTQIAQDYKSRIVGYTQSCQQLFPLRMATIVSISYSIEHVELFCKSIYDFWRVLEHDEKWFDIMQFTIGAHISAKKVKDIIEGGIKVKLDVLAHDYIGAVIEATKISREIIHAYNDIKKDSTNYTEEVNKHIDEYTKLVLILSCIIAKDSLMLSILIRNDFYEYTMKGCIDEDRKEEYDFTFFMRNLLIEDLN